MKHTVPVKPLSVNRAYNGRRFATDDYKAFKRQMAWLLPKRIEVPEGSLEIRFEFGVSSKLSDWDGPIKTAQDCLFEHLKLNDRIVMKGTAEKFIVPKGKEYISFEILPYQNSKSPD